jgi:hypothetical protein
MAKKKYRSQPRIHGVTRTPSYLGLLPELHDHVQLMADMYGVSRSWVEATLLADYFGVKIQADFRKLPRLVNKRAS